MERSRDKKFEHHVEKEDSEDVGGVEYLQKTIYNIFFRFVQRLNPFEIRNSRNLFSIV